MSPRGERHGELPTQWFDGIGPNQWYPPEPAPSAGTDTPEPSGEVELAAVDLKVALAHVAAPAAGPWADVLVRARRLLAALAVAPARERSDMGDEGPDA